MRSPDHVVGNVVFTNAAQYQLPRYGFSCQCPCHNGLLWSIYPSQCWCSCNKQSISVQFNPMNEEIRVLRETVDSLQKRLEVVEAWKKAAKILCDQSKKPHKCPVCNGESKIQITHGIIEAFEKRIIDSAGRHFKLCGTCEGKGIVWG